VIKRAVKKRWIAALRSGKYRQGKGRLCKTSKGRSKFCCLGVLGNEELDGEWELGIDDRVWTLRYKGDADFSVLPRKARVDLGLSEVDEDKLTEMNDTGHSFKEIAVWIEENL